MIIYKKYSHMVIRDEIRLESYENEEYNEIFGDEKDEILEKMINRELIIW